MDEAALVVDLLTTSARRSMPEFRRDAHAFRASGFDAWYVDATGAADLAEAWGYPLEAGLLYVGGSVGITRRVLRDHLSPDTDSTLRHSLLALLRVTGPLTQPELTRWMEVHLRVATVEVPGIHLNAPLREAVIALLDPPLNLRDTPTTPARRHLSALRRASR